MGSGVGSISGVGVASGVGVVFTILSDVVSMETRFFGDESEVCGLQAEKVNVKVKIQISAKYLLVFFMICLSPLNIFFRYNEFTAPQDMQIGGTVL